MVYSGYQKGEEKMFKENLIQLRKLNKLSQEELAEKVGVTRQSIAKWESGDSMPDIEKSRLLAEIFNVTLDDLVNYEAGEALGMPTPPKGKHLFGIVTVGDKGQIVIPAKARKIFNISPGDELVVLGDESQGLAIIKADGFMKIMAMLKGM